MMEHYIVVRVREPDHGPTGPLQAGNVRKQIHGYVLARGLDVADVLIREDRPFVPGTRAPNPHREVKEVFDSVMEPQKATSRLRRERNIR